MSKRSLSAGAGAAFVIAVAIDILLRANLTFAISPLVIWLLSDVRTVALVVVGVLLACAWADGIPSRQRVGIQTGRRLIIIGFVSLAVAIGVGLLGQLVVLDDGFGQSAWPSMLLSLVLFTLTVVGAVMVSFGAVASSNRD